MSNIALAYLKADSSMIVINSFLQCDPILLTVHVILISMFAWMAAVLNRL